MRFADDVVDAPEIGRADLEALLDELQSASQLMEKIAAAKGVLPAHHRRKADQMGKNMQTLYQSGRRRLGDVNR